MIIIITIKVKGRLFDANEHK